MQRKFIFLENFTISYLEENANRLSTLFYVHGNSSSADSWEKQIAEPILSGYRHIAFDLPAHGQSGTSTTPEEDYSPTGLGKIMARVINSLSNNQQYIIIGFSAGTNIVAEMLLHNIHPLGIGLITPSIISKIEDLQKVFSTKTDTSALFDDNPYENAIDALSVQAFYDTHSKQRDLWVKDFLEVKAPFRSMFLKNSLAGKYHDEISLIQKANIPVLILFGNNDAITNSKYLDNVSLPLWNNQIYKFENAGHFVHSDQPEEFSNLLAEFVKSICLNVIN